MAEAQVPESSTIGQEDVPMQDASQGEPQAGYYSH